MVKEILSRVLAVLLVAELKRTCYSPYCVRRSQICAPFDATILAARKLAELEAQGMTRPCPAREMVINDAISKAEEILRKIEKLLSPAS